MREKDKTQRKKSEYDELVSFVLNFIHITLHYIALSFCMKKCIYEENECVTHSIQGKNSLINSLPNEFHLGVRKNRYRKRRAEGEERKRKTEERKR